MAGERHDPTDAEIEDLLRHASDERWAALSAALDEVEQEAEHTTWGGGQQVGTTVVDGVEGPVIEMPYAIYSDATERLLHSLHDLGVLVPFNWPGWEGIEKYRGGTGLNTAPVADAVRLATAIIRADRFSEGTIGATLDDGTLLAALRRLRQWHDTDTQAR